MPQANQVVRLPLSNVAPSLVGPGLSLYGTAPNQALATSYNGTDALFYASDPANPTEQCVISAFAANTSKVIVVSKPIAINNPIVIPDGCGLVFMPGTYPVGNNGQISRGRGSFIRGFGGSDVTIFTMTTGRAVDFIIDTGGVGPGISGQIIGIQGVYPQPDSTNLASYNQFGGSWFIHITKCRSLTYDVKIVGGWKGIFLDGSNSFGATLSYTQSACYNTNLSIDGPVDVTSIDRWEAWPYGPPGTIQATNNQTQAFFNIANTGILLGRADTIVMNKVFTISGLGMHFIEGSTGVATGVEISSSGFENNGLLMEADGSTCSAAATYYGVDTQEQFAIAIGAGLFQGSGLRIYNAIVPGTGVAVSNPLAYCNRVTGVLQPTGMDLSNCEFSLQDADQTAVYYDAVDATHMSYGSLIGCKFNYTANKAYTNPIFNMGFADVNIIGGRYSPLGTGSQVWFKNGQLASKAIGSLNRINGRTDAVLGGSTDVHLLNNF